MNIDMQRCFVQDIVDHPLDESIRLIYADWLDEHNDPFAEVMRRSVSLGVLTVKCDRDVRERGTVVYVVDARVSTWVMEGWTQFVAHASGQRVDWVPFQSWSGSSKLLKAFGVINEVADVVKWLLPVLRAWHNHDSRKFPELYIHNEEDIGRFEFGVKWEGRVEGEEAVGAGQGAGRGAEHRAGRTGRWSDYAGAVRGPHKSEGR